MLRPVAVLAAIAAVATSLAAGDPSPGVHDNRADHHKMGMSTGQDGEMPKERLSDVACVDGHAGPFTCDGVDLLGFIPHSEVLNSVNTARAQSYPNLALSEVWGWVDGTTGNEYALVGNVTGMAIFDVTDPTDATYLGDVINHSPHQETWYDIKVSGDHAIITSESSGIGMQVFDLTRLRGVTAPQRFVPDAIYAPNLAAHNVVVNEDSGYAYLVGSGTLAAYYGWYYGGIDPELCAGGLHMVDISEPTLPLFAGCFRDDGYTHDAHCIIYDGPDEDWTDREVCALFNEDDVLFVDVSDKLAPAIISRLTYPDPVYTHQGWFTEDRSYLVFNDEEDEIKNKSNTTTFVADVRDLDNPIYVGVNRHKTTSVDHNLYVHEGLVWEANYTTGLRVLSTAGIATADLPTVAWFDTFPRHDDPSFEGSWSAYPFLPSGTIVVSGGSGGLFLLRLQDDGLRIPATS